MTTRKAYRYVEAQYLRFEAEGKTPTVTVHLDSGYSFNIRSLASYVSEKDDRNYPDWLVFVREPPQRVDAARRRPDHRGVRQGRRDHAGAYAR